MPVPRAIMDTNVLLGALWSPRGTNFQVLQALRQGRWRLVLSNHLVSEYAEVCGRHAADIDLSIGQIDDILDALCMGAEQWHLASEWWPRLVDPDDEPLVQLAVEASVPVIISRDERHLRPAAKFGIRVLTPPLFLSMLQPS